jgi:aldose 1-epimerase
MQTKFEILSKSFDSQQLIEIKNKVTGEYLQVLPRMGGLLFQVSLLFNNKLTTILNNYESVDEMNEIFWNTYKGSLLFPFPNRIGEGKYSFNNENYQLPLNFPHENNAIHGLVYNKSFKTVKETITEQDAELKLQFTSDGSLPGYPFKFDLTVSYSLDINGSITIKTAAKNTDKVNIPTGNGWHPYFMFFDTVDNTEICFPSEEAFAVNQQMLPSGEKEVFKDFNKLTKLNKTHFDTCFSIENSVEKAVSQIYNRKQNIGVSIWQETGKDKYNYLQIYTPPDRSCIAIEPMTCLPNAFNKTEDEFKVLTPDEEVNYCWGINKIQNL